MPSGSTTGAFWCYRCTRFVSPLSHEGDDSLSCPRCSGGFIEHIDSHAFPPSRLLPPYSPTHRRRLRRVPAGATTSNYNPVVVLRGPTTATDTVSESQNAYEFFYDDGSGSGLQPLPSTMSEFLLGSGFDRLLEQLAQLELAGFSRPENPPASKAAVESMPRVAIGSDHLVAELHCAVCKEQFELRDEAREMPCKHMYHQECILPWLATRNSCPVCRHELPTEANENAEGAVGMTIWRLPGGGFAVGRFRRERERERETPQPAVYTEVEGVLGGESGEWGMRSSRGNSERGSGGFGSMMRNFLGFLRGSEGRRFRRSQSSSGSVIGRHVRRRGNGTFLVMDD
ncbi:hypothetical protein MLD38_003967 [Melastoma candidum]|uniref:Uncharacterized protein n=1 Tax=Melastoma candidum TaxID=119954 RepID=A0ACB9SCP7_9MYRT|nr:hypothetical protein MLD38_003967 [Melastoma candidum]